VADEPGDRGCAHHDQSSEEVERLLGGPAGFPRVVAVWQCRTNRAPQGRDDLVHERMGTALTGARRYAICPNPTLRKSGPRLVSTGARSVGNGFERTAATGTRPSLRVCVARHAHHGRI
jgi:hypothetical protein